MLIILEACTLSRLPLLLTFWAKSDWKLADHYVDSSTLVTKLSKDSTLFESDFDIAWLRNFCRLYTILHMRGGQSVDRQAGHVAGEVQYVSGCQWVCDSGSSEEQMCRVM